MKLDELQAAAEQLSPAEQKKLIGFLVAIDLRRDAAYRNELTNRLSDKNAANWISLKELKDRLKRDGI